MFYTHIPHCLLYVNMAHTHCVTHAHAYICMYYTTYVCTVTLDTPTPYDYAYIHVTTSLVVRYVYHKRLTIAVALGLRELVTTPALGAAPGMTHLSSRSVCA